MHTRYAVTAVAFAWLFIGCHLDTSGMLNNDDWGGGGGGPPVPVPVQKNFTTTGSLLTGRSGHTATLLPNGKVLIAGGVSPDGYAYDTALTSAELYDQTTGTFSATGSMGARRSAHTATALPDGKVLLVGGITGMSTITSSELYDPVTGTFSVAGSLSTGRHSHTATLLANGKVLIAGGFEINPNAPNGNGNLLGSTELYDPTTRSFTAGGTLATARTHHTATLLISGLVLMIGGGNSGAELLDSATGGSTIATAITELREFHTATLLLTGRALVAGGAGESGCLSSAYLYDPATETAQTTGNMGEGRFGHTGTLLLDGRVLVAGGIGCGVPGTYFASAELYDSVTGAFSVAGSMGARRMGHTATLLPNGKVLVVGGEGSAGASAELFP